MRMPRFKMRTMMVAVAMLALTGWSVRIAERGAHYRRLARVCRDFEVLYAQAERNTKGTVENYESNIDRRQIADAERNPARIDEMSPVIGRLFREREDLAHYSKMRHHYSKLGSEYEHAARVPWFPVEPDPPAPE